MPSLPQILIREHRSLVILFLTVVGGLLTYLPLTMKSNLEDSIVADSIRNGPLFRIGIVASISLATPFFMNNLADVIMNFFEAKKTAKKVTTAAPPKTIVPLLSTYEKLLFISGILMVPVVSCFTQWNRAILMVACTYCAQKHVVFGTILSSLNRFNDHYFPTSIIYFLLFISTVASISRSFAVNTCATISHAECSLSPILMFSHYESLIGYTILVMLVSFWLSSVVVTRLYGEEIHAQYYRWPSWCGVVETTAQNTLPSNTSRVDVTTKKAMGPADNGFLLSFRIIYFCTVIAWGIFVVVNNGFYASTGYTYSHSNDKTLLIYCVPYIMFELAGLFFALRMVKNQTVSALLALIDAKKTYVRYISHELRTPLSAANSGLQMLQAELSATASTNPADEDRLDTVNDVCSAINTTLNILDDLLTFEKMESGLMVLHKTDVNVESFIDSCISIFHTPARGKDITIKMELCDRSVESSLPVDSTDLFFIDKFKMSQVIRNFMSNALKFTPNGGTITVRACFIPDKNTATKAMNNGQTTGMSASRRPLEIESTSIRTKDGLVYADLETGSDIDDNDDDSRPLSSTRTQAQQGMLRISVLDSGAGISPENQKRLFNEIIQFNPEILQAGGGSGFGLYICKGIVDLHEGSINVFSEGEGKGTMFSILLPMKRISEDILDKVATTSECRRYSIPAMTQRLMHDMERATPNTSPKITPFSSPRATPRNSITKHDPATSQYGVLTTSDANTKTSFAAEFQETKDALLPFVPNITSSTNGFDHDPERSGLFHDVRTTIRSVELSVQTLLPPLATTSLSTEITNGSRRTSVVDDIHNIPSKPPTTVTRISNGGDGENTKYHILVVDDSPLNRKMLTKLLKSKGHSIEEAADGQIAVDKVKQEADAGRYYDVILMDFVMPVMDGPTATRALRAMQIKSPIFGLTGNALESDVAFFLNSGVDSVLIKPFSMVEFLSSMASVAIRMAAQNNNQ